MTIRKIDISMFKFKPFTINGINYDPKEKFTNLVVCEAENGTIPLKINSNDKIKNFSNRIRISYANAIYLFSCPNIRIENGVIKNTCVFLKGKRDPWLVPIDSQEYKDLIKEIG